MKNKLTILIIISLFIVNGSQAQNKKRAKKTVLKGLVIDTENNPVKEASVFIDGKNCKALSDEKGLFKLKLKPDVKTITIFTLEHGALEVPYMGEPEMTFVLLAVSEILGEPKNDDNVVKASNSNYVKAHKRNLSSRMNTVNSNIIKNADRYVTIYDMIKGEMGGVSVSGSTVVIRGVGTLMASNAPLYVVNGAPVISIDHIRPGEVKSITILKGPSAALYGVRGANGVIVITLKTAVDD